MVNISFSWDDGAVEDLRLMDLSMKYNINGMFFIPVINHERKVVSTNEIKMIDRNNFEIGAHTYSHRYLPGLELSEAEEEIIRGREHLQQLLGRKIDHFCFPGGKYNDKLIKVAKNNFISARTADTGATITKRSFLIRPAMHFFDRGKLSLLLNSIKNMSAINPAIIKNFPTGTYFDMLRKIIYELAKSERTYSIIIWGHSWEIEEYSLWNELNSIFDWLNKEYSSHIMRYSEIIL